MSSRKFQPDLYLIITLHDGRLVLQRAIPREGGVSNPWQITIYKPIAAPRNIEQMVRQHVYAKFNLLLSEVPHKLEYLFPYTNHACSVDVYKLHLEDAAHLCVSGKNEVWPCFFGDIFDKYKEDHTQLSALGMEVLDVGDIMGVFKDGRS